MGAVQLPILLALIAAEPPVLAVFDLENAGAPVNAQTLTQLSELVSAQLAASRVFRVVPKTELKKALASKKAESYQACYAESCQIEIGQELAAEQTLAGKLHAFGKSCVLTLTLYDLRRATSVGGGSASGACTPEALLNSVSIAVGQVVAAETAPAPVKSPEPTPAPQAPNPPAEPTAQAGPLPDLDAPTTPHNFGPRVPSYHLPHVLEARFGDDPRRAEQIDLISRQLKKNPDPGLLFRMAELAYLEGNSLARNKKSAKYLNLAKNAAEQLLKEFPKYEKLDAVLYFLGATPDLHRNSKKYWLRLLRDHPQSKYLPRTYVGLADQLFVGGRFQDAEALYLRVAPDPTLGDYARYKTAWCQGWQPVAQSASPAHGDILAPGLATRS